MKVSYNKVQIQFNCPCFVHVKQTKLKRTILQPDLLHVVELEIYSCLTKSDSSFNFHFSQIYLTWVSHFESLVGNRVVNRTSKTRQQ